MVPNPKIFRQVPDFLKDQLAAGVPVFVGGDNAPRASASRAPARRGFNAERLENVRMATAGVAVQGVWGSMEQKTGLSR